VPTHDETAAPRPALPTSVRVAVIVMAVLAALLISNAALLWYAYDETVDRIVREADDVSRDEARRFVLLSLVPNLVVGLMLALSAWFLPRRQAWARWMGLAASGLLALLSVIQFVTAGGISVPSLLLLVLSVAAVTSLLARTTGEFVPKLRAGA
jgi:hypothetical protein